MPDVHVDGEDDPSKLTVQELKRRLRSVGAALPPNVKKVDLLAIYGALYASSGIDRAEESCNAASSSALNSERHVANDQPPAIAVERTLVAERAASAQSPTTKRCRLQAPALGPALAAAALAEVDRGQTTERHSPSGIPKAKLTPRPADEFSSRAKGRALNVAAQQSEPPLPSHMSRCDPKPMATDDSKGGAKARERCAPSPPTERPSLTATLLAVRSELDYGDGRKSKGCDGCAGGLLESEANLSDADDKPVGKNKRHTVSDAARRAPADDKPGDKNKNAKNPDLPTVLELDRKAPVDKSEKTDTLRVSDSSVPTTLAGGRLAPKPLSSSTPVMHRGQPAERLSVPEVPVAKSMAKTVHESEDGSKNQERLAAGEPVAQAIEKRVGTSPSSAGVVHLGSAGSLRDMGNERQEANRKRPRVDKAESLNWPIFGACPYDTLRDPFLEEMGASEGRTLKSLYRCQDGCGQCRAGWGDLLPSFWNRKFHYGFSLSTDDALAWREHAAEKRRLDSIQDAEIPPSKTRRLFEWFVDGLQNRGQKRKKASSV